MHISFKHLFYIISCLFGVFAILILAKPVLIPLAFALLIAFILLPLVKQLERWGMGNIPAALLSIVFIVLLLSGGIFLFSAQLIDLSSKVSDFQDKILQTFTKATLFFNSHLSFLPSVDENEIITRLKDWVSESAGLLVSKTFNNTASFLGGLVSVIIFTFLILIYRKGFAKAFALFFPENDRSHALVMLKKVQLVGKKYLLGMVVLIIILGTANSVGLLIIGIDNPFLFGFLAGILAIIPYLGTLIGAAIPVLYAYLFYDPLWKPVAVVILFWVVQSVESNFLNPKIVGKSLNINALTAILSIIIGAAVWGIAGMILFLPFASMFKTVCEQYEKLKPVALLIGEHNVDKKQDNTDFIKRCTDRLVSVYRYIIQRFKASE